VVVVAGGAVVEVVEEEVEVGVVVGFVGVSSPPRARAASARSTSAAASALLSAYS